MICLVFLVSCKGKSKVTAETVETIIPESSSTVYKSENQTIPFYSFDEFEKLLHQQDGKLIFGRHGANLV